MGLVQNLQGKVKSLLLQGFSGILRDGFKVMGAKEQPQISE
jgi:hypothetical protein